MKNTKELLSAQNWALVEVIHWLDQNKHSNKTVCESWEYALRRIKE